jgi:hypothetical protein
VDVTRLVAPAARVERYGSVTRRHRVGPRVLAAREPKLLRASTRLAAARTRLWPAPAPVETLASPAPSGAWEVSGNYSDFLPKPSTEPASQPSSAVRRVPQRSVAAAPAQRVKVARAPAPATPAPAAAPPPAPAPAITAESLGLGPASFEWLFGDPDKALAHPDVTADPFASLPALSPAEQSARRLARLTARGGSPYGRGARISEGPAKSAEAPAPSGSPARPEAVALSEVPTRPEPPAPATSAETVEAPAAAVPPDAPAAPTPAAVNRQPAPVLQRVARDLKLPPAPRAKAAPAATPTDDRMSSPAPSPSPAPARARQRLVPGRRLVTAVTRELARAAADPAMAAMPIDAPGMNPAVAPKPPPPPSPGPPPIRPIAPVPMRRVTSGALEAAAVAPARAAVQRVPRPTPAAPRQPSLFRRAIAALNPRPREAVATPDFGDQGAIDAPSAPKSGVALARMTLGTRPALAVPAPRVEPLVAPEQERTLGERKLWPGDSAPPAARAEATAPAPAPTASTPPAISAPATGHGDPDAAYRDLLHRLREEREQLGQLITHPF